MIHLFKQTLFNPLPKTCHAAQRDRKAGSQDPFDVRDGVEESGRPAESRMGALHDPPTRY